LLVGYGKMGRGGQRAYENEVSIGIQLGGYVVCHVVVEEGGACDKEQRRVGLILEERLGNLPLFTKRRNLLK